MHVVLETITATSGTKMEAHSRKQFHANCFAYSKTCVHKCKQTCTKDQRPVSTSASRLVQKISKA
eukprot:822294-Amphidinium_carterae.1